MRSEDLRKAARGVTLRSPRLARNGKGEIVVENATDMIATVIGMSIAIEIEMTGQGFIDPRMAGPVRKGEGIDS